MKLANNGCGSNGFDFKFKHENISGGELGFNDKPPTQEFEDPPAPNQMMLLSDMVLAWDAEFRSVLEEYAEDEELLKKDFGAAFQKLTELGCPWAK